MAEQTNHDLGYGHFGQYLYDSTSKTWISRRILGLSYALTPLAPSQWAVKPQTSDTDQAIHAPSPLEHGLETSKPSRRIAIQSAALMRQLPTLTPAAKVSAELAHLSHDITAVTARHDPNLGNLLAFGRVMDRLTRRTIPVAAFPVRASPGLLRLFQVQPQKQGWEHHKGIWIDVSRLSGESATWDAGQPILHVCFCAPRTEDTTAPTNYLAVRTSLAVHVLRVSMARHTTLTQSLPTRFQIIPVHTLNLDAFGGIAPADVAFNPFFEKQLATIDHNGTWRIWDLSRQPVGHHGKTVQVASGAVADRLLANPISGGQVLDDGWGRIVFAPDTATVIVASRRAIGIYDVSDKPLRLLSPDLAIENTPHWILDIQAQPNAYPIVFVLTSIRLICLTVKPLANLDPSDYETAGAETIFQTAHFRDPEDISLRLYTFMDGEDIVVLLKSSTSLVATSYRCTFVETSEGKSFLSVSDPTLVTLPETPVDGSSSISSSGLHIQPALYGKAFGGPAGPGEIYENCAIRFYMFTSITADGCIVEKLYFARPSDDMAMDDSIEVLPPSWYGRLTHGASRLKKERFVVDDDEGLDELDRDGLRFGQQSSPNRQTRQKPPERGRKNWTLTYENTYNRINKQNPDHTQEFTDAVSTVRNQINTADGPQQGGISTLYDLSQAEMSVGDLDEATMQFRGLLFDDMDNDILGTADGPSRVRPSILSATRLLGLAVVPDDQIGPTAIYDGIISHWLAPISERVPGRMRLAKEQLARRVAAEVCLASCGTKGPAMEQSQEELPETLEESTQGQSLASTQPQSSFPTPSPTATPSLTTATSLSSHPSTMASAEYLRLQRYTSFSAEKPTPGPLPKALAKKLAHWTVGTDPEEYDWLSTQRQQEKEAEEEDEDIGPKERARLKKRAEKHLRKQRRETLKAASMDLASSQAPEIVSASQPAAMSRSRTKPPTGKASAASQGVISSSQATQSQAQQFPASQVEPGKYGGRPAAKKRKRTIGF